MSLLQENCIKSASTKLFDQLLPKDIMKGFLFEMKCSLTHYIALYILTKFTAHIQCIDIGILLQGRRGRIDFYVQVTRAI